MATSVQGVGRQASPGAFSSVIRLRVVVPVLAYLYWLVFENVVFFYPEDFGGSALANVTDAVKVLVPVALLAYSGLPGRRAMMGSIGAYVAAFGIFLLWAAVPTLAFGDPIEFVKILPRYLYLIAMVALFLRHPQSFDIFAKLVILSVLLALVQWAVLTLVPIDFSTRVLGVGVILAGPLGLLGNITSRMYLPGLDGPIYRLTGFWNEPSNASGTAFAAFFLARFLAARTGKQFWRWSSYLCLGAGFLALSNAGYISFGVALLAGLFLRSNPLALRKVALGAASTAVAVILILLALFGRSYVVQNLQTDARARAVTGVRDLNTQYVDPLGGRLDLAASTLRTTSEAVFGIGIQPVGSSGIDASASAPLFWLLLTGFPGLLLLLAREMALLPASLRLNRTEPLGIFLIQALVVVMAQHSIYGSWMNPNYLTLAAVVLAYSFRAREIPALRPQS